MKRESWKLLLDALEAGHSIRQHCTGKNFEQYAADRWFRRAVEREFEIIGEALNRLPRIDAETAVPITALRRIVDFRNRIIHGYDAIDDLVVGGVIEKDLPVLNREIEQLMGGNGQTDGSGPETPATVE